jgi:multidrug efflux pump
LIARFFAAVISILIVMAGLAAGRVLPVKQYPNVVPPRVVVSASYPGATAETIAETVAAPLEAYVDGVDGMAYMQSSSTDAGSMNLVITFAVGTDPDLAAINVSNEIQGAMGRLPDVVRNQGVSVEKSSPAILQMVTLTSPGGSLDATAISAYAQRNIRTGIRRAPGVGDQTLFGARIYSMRIWLRPNQMAEYSITPGDIVTAVQEQNAQYAAGTFGAEPSDADLDFTYSVTTPGRLVNAEEFGAIILRSGEDSSTLRLRDVARVELGVHDYSFRATHNGEVTVPIGIYLKPGANALETAQGIRDVMEEVSKDFPDDLEYDIPFDTSSFIDASLRQVLITLIQALVLVVAVVYLFLQRIRAALIPIVAVPVSLIGTLAGMYAFGFSINMLTLFGLILAIGIVVDNAIIVLENAERILSTEDVTPREAASRTVNEVAGPIIAMTLVTIAVFVPVMFIGGLTGQMYQQFAVTIAVSVAISGVVALTLSPALCAMLLSKTPKTPAAPFRWFNRRLDWVTGLYVSCCRFLMKHTALGLGLFVILLVVIAGMFRMVPEGLVPAEDQGYLYTEVDLPPAASLGRTERAMEQVSEITRNFPETSDVIAFSGMGLGSGASRSYSGTAYVTLENWTERTEANQSSDAVLERIESETAHITEAKVTASNPPPIAGLSATGGLEAFLQSRRGDDVPTLLKQTQAFIEAANQRPELNNVTTRLRNDVPRYHVDLDRKKALDMGVPASSVFAAMQSTLGEFYVNDFYFRGRAVRVHMQAESSFREGPEDLDQVFVRSTDGELIPLSTLVTVERTRGPDRVDRLNVYPSAQITAEPAEGFSSGEAIEAMEAVASELLSDDYQLSWTGTAYQQKESGGSSQMALILGVVMVLLILAAQYERWSLPLAVLSAVPFAIFGALLAVWLAGMENDIYFQIGLLVLISLAAKNAILIVEFAVLKRDEGLSVAESALEAARLRFRPILMTALSFILGVVPLALSSGAGANSQQAVGVGIIGGMISATFLAILFVPMFYYLITTLGESVTGRLRQSFTTSDSDV